MTTFHFRVRIRDPFAVAIRLIRSFFSDCPGKLPSPLLSTILKTSLTQHMLFLIEEDEVHWLDRSLHYLKL